MWKPLNPPTKLQAVKHHIQKPMVAAGLIWANMLLDALRSMTACSMQREYTA